MKLRISLVLPTLFLVYSQVLFSKDANWLSQEIYSGSHVNSATAHDYSGDGKMEISEKERRPVGIPNGSIIFGKSANGI